MTKPKPKAYLETCAIDDSYRLTVPGIETISLLRRVQVNLLLGITQDLVGKQEISITLKKPKVIQETCKYCGEIRSRHNRGTTKHEFVPTEVTKDDA